MINQFTDKDLAEAYQPLFDYLSNEFGISLLVSEMDEIRDKVDIVNDTLTIMFTDWCDVEGCNNESNSGGAYWREEGYWRLCSMHCSYGREGNPFPKMKEGAVLREQSRGEDGVLPNDNKW